MDQQSFKSLHSRHQTTSILELENFKSTANSCNQKMHFSRSIFSASIVAEDSRLVLNAKQYERNFLLDHRFSEISRDYPK